METAVRKYTVIRLDSRIGMEEHTHTQFSFGVEERCGVHRIKCFSTKKQQHQHCDHFHFENDTLLCARRAQATSIKTSQ